MNSSLGLFVPVFTMLFFLLSSFILPYSVLSSPPPSRPYTPPRFLQVVPASAPESHAHWRDVHLPFVASRPGLLQTSRPHLRTIKSLAPHSFLGFDGEGNVVFLQQPGLIDFRGLREAGVDDGQLMDHFVYTFEYTWEVLDFLTDRPLGPSPPCGSASEPPRRGGGGG